MTSLIVGSSGFVGSNLLRHIKSERLLTLNRGTFANDSYDLFCDFDSPKELKKIFETFNEIEEIYILIGSFSNSVEDIHVNVSIPIKILEALRLTRHSPRILLIGSSAEYGSTLEEVKVVSERSELSPVSLYGLSKMFLSQVMEFYVRVHKMDIVYARVFNVLGPGMNRKLLFGKVYAEIADSSEKELTISTGSLDAKLDYISVEKLCKALITVMRQGRIGEVYNIGSGKASGMRDLLLDFLREYCNVEFTLNIDENLRPRILYSCANIEKLKSIKE